MKGNYSCTKCQFRLHNFVCVFFKCILCTYIYIGTITDPILVVFIWKLLLFFLYMLYVYAFSSFSTDNETRQSSTFCYMTQNYSRAIIRLNFVSCIMPFMPPRFNWHHIPIYITVIWFGNNLLVNIYLPIVSCRSIQLQ